MIKLSSFLILEFFRQDFCRISEDFCLIMNQRQNFLAFLAIFLHFGLVNDFDLPVFGQVNSQVSSFLPFFLPSLTPRHLMLNLSLENFSISFPQEQSAAAGSSVVTSGSLVVTSGPSSPQTNVGGFFILHLSVLTRASMLFPPHEKDHFSASSFLAPRHLLVTVPLPSTFNSLPG